MESDGGSTQSRGRRVDEDNEFGIEEEDEGGTERCSSDASSAAEMSLENDTIRNDGYSGV